MVFSIFTQLCSYHHYLILEHLHHAKKKPLPVSRHSPFLPLLCSRQLEIHSLSLWICQFWTFHIDGILQYVAFCDWLLSLSIMFFIHVMLYIRTSFLYGGIIVYYIDIPHFIYLFTSWWTFELFPLFGYYE